MRKWLMMLLTALLMTTTACAETTGISWEDCCLTLPEGAAAPVLTWVDGAGEPRLAVITVPEEQRAEVLTVMEASPDWMLDGMFDVKSALALLKEMHCTELPDLPEDMAFEWGCFWVGDIDFGDTNGEALMFMMTMVIGNVALNGEQVIDIPLRMGFYDADTGTLLMAGWLEYAE